MSEYSKSSLQLIWDQTLDKLKSGGFFDDSIFNSFIKDSKLYELTATSAIVIVPNFVSRSTYIKNQAVFENALNEVAESDVKITFALKKEIKDYTELNVENQKIILKDKLLEKYTFDNFIVGNSNRESQAAALSCAASPGEFFNPLFIYGNSGLGKTHLLHAIGNYVKKHAPEKKVIYIYSEDFISLIVNSIRDKTIEEVKRIIEDADYLLIDDIQRLKQGERSQEIFFNLYNHLFSKGKQIVLTSDIHPTELKGIENRLISRFNSGLSVGIDSPEFETALAILKQKIEERNEQILIEDSVLEYLATTYSSDVRELEGNLNKLIFKAILYNPEVIDLDFAILAFKDDPNNNSPDVLTVSKIKKTVCDFYGLTRTQLESKTKTTNISNARHIAIYLCRKHLDMPFAKIGAEFGGRDHSTIMASFEKVTKLIGQKELFASAVSKIEKKLGVE